MLGYRLVISNSDAPPTVEGRWGIPTVGALWIQQNFPIAYAGLITELMKNMSKWHEKGKVIFYAYDAYEEFVEARMQSTSKNKRNKP